MQRLRRTARLGLVLNLGLVLLAPPALAASADGAGGRLTLAQLRAPAALPEPVEPDGLNDQPFAPVFMGCGSAADTRESAGVLVYLLAHSDADSNKPYWQWKLGNVLADLDQDAAAFQALGKVLDLPERTAMTNKMREVPNLAELKCMAHLIRARILARNGLRADCVKELALAQPHTGYQQLLQAEALALAGSPADAVPCLRQACRGTSGYFDGNWGTWFIPMRGAALAQLIGDKELFQELAKPILARRRDAEKWGQWHAVWSVTDAFSRLPKAKRVAEPAKLRSGTYSGKCRGFDDDVAVVVTVAAGKIKSVEVTKENESRPFSALEIIPKRIVRCQGVRVDAVTGATVTSLAIVGATEDALSRPPK